MPKFDYNPDEFDLETPDTSEKRHLEVESMLDAESHQHMQEVEAERQAYYQAIETAEEEAYQRMMDDMRYDDILDYDPYEEINN